MKKVKSLELSYFASIRDGKNMPWNFSEKFKGKKFLFKALSDLIFYNIQLLKLSNFAFKFLCVLDTRIVGTKFLIHINQLN